MNEDSGAEYLTPWKLSESADGGGVGVVQSSRHDAYREGDVVTSFTWPWQTHAVVKGSILQKVETIYFYFFGMIYFWVMYELLQIYSKTIVYICI